MTGFVHSDDIRARFSRAMSVMYRTEVPAYGTLLDLVSDINNHVLDQDNALKEKLDETDNLARISEERHGAIRLGKASELRMMARVFAVMGMRPVSYYDLTQANVPVHSTAFRSIDAQSLSRSPFRVFTSLLRTELIKDDVLRERSEKILAERDIFTPRLYELIEKAEQDGGLSEADTNSFIEEATYTFKWHEDAAVDKDFYEALREADPRAADIVCFKGPHINHLTPRTLEIDIIHKDMPQRGMNPKNVVEGPPASCPILLRQTSFRALTEKVRFGGEEGLHTARFGEIEQRGAALTPKGRALYDQILGDVRTRITPSPDGSNAAEYMTVLEEEFTNFPSSPTEMREQELAYFQYYVTKTGQEQVLTGKSLNQLIELGFVDFIPITYEDFLPVSAAGIFASNASDKTRVDAFKSSSQEEFENALGQAVSSEFELYKAMEERSIAKITG
ncbi:MAG: 2-oxoadipate dioxygenase/decarboxylase HglS [Alphaproteobacteria bacterium]